MDAVSSWVDVDSGWVDAGSGWEDADSDWVDADSDWVDAGSGWVDAGSGWVDAASIWVVAAYGLVNVASGWVDLTMFLRRFQIFGKVFIMHLNMLSYLPSMMTSCDRQLFYNFKLDLPYITCIHLASDHTI